MLEREREFAECRLALDAALAGRGGIVAVEGPAGIGKTELLRSVTQLARAKRLRVSAARGVDVERDLPFGGVHQWFDPLVREYMRDGENRIFSGAAAPAGRLWSAQTADEGAPGDPFATLNGLYWVLATLADVGPLILIADDAHWLDPPSLRLLEFLLPRIEELAALVLVASRPVHDEIDAPALGRVLTDPTTLTIHLRPLSRSAVRTLVATSLGGEPDDAFVDACLDVTGGNPFYIRELLREVANRGTGLKTDPGLIIEIGPRAIPRLLRFRGLASKSGMVLARAVAVLGERASLPEAAQVAGLATEEAARAGDALVREGVLSPGGLLTFTHPIVRTAIYEEMGPIERSEAHRVAARLALKRGAPMQIVATHLTAAQPGDETWVVDTLRTAAQDAMAKGAPDTAVIYLRRALEEPPSLETVGSVMAELAVAEVSAAQPDAPDHILAAYVATADLQTRADLAIRGALVLFQSGRAADAVEMLVRVSGELASIDPERALEVEAELAALAVYDPATAGHVSRLDRFPEDMPADTLGSCMVLCQLAYRRMWQANDAARAADLAARAMSSGVLLRARGTESFHLTAAALTFVFADRIQEAQQLLDSALGMAREQGSRHGFAHVAYLRSELAYRRGSLPDTEAEANSSLEIALPAGLAAGAALDSGVLAVVHVERGEHDKAGAALTRVGLMSGDIPLAAPFNRVLAARGHLRLAQGDYVAALADLEECGRRTARLGIRIPLFFAWRTNAALAHRALGNIEAARALGAEEAAAARDWGTPGNIGAAERVNALIGPPGEAIERLEMAADELAVSPAALELARALVDLGAALRRANHRADGRKRLEDGLDLAEGCGATILALRARQELAALGIRGKRRPLIGSAALTPSERRVAQMAAAGMGNVEIAQTLFVTRKTVEKHLSNAYAKLGVASRNALSAKFDGGGRSSPNASQL